MPRRTFLEKHESPSCSQGKIKEGARAMAVVPQDHSPLTKAYYATRRPYLTALSAMNAWSLFIVAATMWSLKA
jgi:hypothetical protein